MGRGSQKYRFGSVMVTRALLRFTKHRKRASSVWAGYRSARLSTRLLLIVLTCLVPVIVLAVWVEYGQWAERRANSVTWPCSRPNC